MINEINIRNGTNSDIPELYEVLNNTLELRGYSEGEAYSHNWLKEVITDNKRNIVLVAQKNKILLGFLIAHVLAGRDILLNDLYVKPDYRKVGIASMLMKKLENISKRIKSTLTIALTSLKNKKMQNLFEKYNYKKGHTFYYFY